MKAAIKRTEPGPSNEREEKPVQTSLLWEKFDASLSLLQGKGDPRAQAVVEINKYLNQPYSNRTNDLLKWWDSRKFIYPNSYAITLRKVYVFPQ